MKAGSRLEIAPRHFGFRGHPSLRPASGHRRLGGHKRCRVRFNFGVKLLFEILVAIFLHPVAFVLAVVNIVGRTELSGVQKVIWIIVSFLWGIGPILYVLVGGGRLW